MNFSQNNSVLNVMQYMNAFKFIIISIIDIHFNHNSKVNDSYAMNSILDKQ